MPHILVDLDGTLAEYDKDWGPEYIGDPIPRMVERVKLWRRQGHDVRIFTARVSVESADEREVARAVIEAWCYEHLGEVLPVTCVKDFECLELFDDRAWRVQRNTGRVLREPGQWQEQESLPISA